MSEEVNTGGVHTFRYERKNYTDEEERQIRKRWGKPPRSWGDDGYIYNTLKRMPLGDKVLIALLCVIAGVSIWILTRH